MALPTKLRQRYRVVDAILLRLEAYGALLSQYGIEPAWALRFAVGAMLAGWTYLAESWLPISAAAGLMAFVALSFLKPATHKKVEKTSPEPQPILSYFPGGLYVGEMNVDASHLGDEFYLEIAILGFNATGGSISIGEASGALAACEVTADQSSNRIDLPPAVIMHERTPTHNIGDLNQFFVVLYQQISRPDAERFSALLTNGGRIRSLL